MILHRFKMLPLLAMISCSSVSLPPRALLPQQTSPLLFFISQAQVKSDRTGQYTVSVVINNNSREDITFVDLPWHTLRFKIGLLILDNLEPTVFSMKEPSSVIVPAFSRRKIAYDLKINVKEQLIKCDGILLADYEKQHGNLAVKLSIKYSGLDDNTVESNWLKIDY